MPLFTLDLEDDYSLIGIHSTEEDYRLAYLINKHLNTKLVRNKESLDFKNSEAEFSIFNYNDELNFINFSLISNKHIDFSSTKLIEEGLFKNNFSTIYYLIPEKKNIDYFLKIEGGDSDEFFKKLNSDLNKIEQIITSYLIEPSSLKSKNHLIF